MSSPILSCVSCGASVDGRFCSQCGAPTGERYCAGCGTRLSPGAPFCHRCGSAATPTAAAAPGREKGALVVGAVAVLVAVAAAAFFIGRGTGSTPTVPSMANAGNAVPTVGGTRAPDISTMSPRERFDRLFDRVVRAAEAQSSDTVLLFAPMALGAYEQLDAVDADARYHAAMIQMVVGEYDGAAAKADTILAGRPTHLFGFVIRGEVAEQRNDGAALAAAQRDFLAAWEGEIAAGLQEYNDHMPVLTDFRNRATASRR